MSKTKMAYGLMLGALASAGTASAAITSPTIVDFGTRARNAADTVIPVAFNGFADTAKADGTCAEGTCAYQNGMVIGVVSDPDGAHLHPAGSIGSTSNRNVDFHEDSTGYYFRALDSTAFQLTSFKFNSVYDDASNYYAYTADGTPNPDHSATNDVFEILGFSDAVNVGLNAGNGTDYANRVAYQTVENGFNGTVVLNDDFKNVAAVWIHYKGIPSVAAVSQVGKVWKVNLDDISVGAAVAAPVPVPAAVWMFGTGLMGLLSFGRGKAKRVA